MTSSWSAKILRRTSGQAKVSCIFLQSWIHSHCDFTSSNEYKAQVQNKNSAMRYKKAA